MEMASYSLLALCLLCAAAAPAQTVPEGILPSVEPVAPSDLPSVPPGKTTVMGGRIEKVDLVRDQFALKVFGGHAITVLFDERTSVYRDGKKMSVLDLNPDDHASVETILDGPAIFAVRIHMLSDLPEGQFQGQIASYDSQTGKLKMRLTGSNDSIDLMVPAGIPVVRVGQEAFSAQQAGTGDLVQGAVVEVAFKAKGAGPGSATHVNVLAVPGSAFVFQGNLSFLDLRAGRMTIDGTAEGKAMDIAFDPSRFAVSHDLHKGSSVNVTARFDGARYVATEIKVE